MLAPMKSKSQTARASGRPSIVPWPVISASSSPLFSWGTQLFEVTAAIVGEPQRVFGPHVGVPFLKRSRVGEERDAVAGAQAEMVIAFRTDSEIILQFFGVDQFAAFRAFDPEAIGSDRKSPFVLDLHRSELVAAMKKPAIWLPLVTVEAIRRAHE